VAELFLGEQLVFLHALKAPVLVIMALRAAAWAACVRIAPGMP
jgi:hypothetical protein